MDKTYHVAVIIGSWRKDSIHRKVTNPLANPPELEMSVVEIGELPIFANKQA